MSKPNQQNEMPKVPGSLPGLPVPAQVVGVPVDLDAKAKDLAAFEALLKEQSDALDAKEELLKSMEVEALEKRKNLEADEAELDKISAELEAKAKELDGKAVVAPKVEKISKEKQAILDAFKSGKPVFVRANQKGIYPNCKRRARDEEFELKEASSWSDWMVLIKPSAK